MVELRRRAARSNRHDFKTFTVRFQRPRAAIGLQRFAHQLSGQFRLARDRRHRAGDGRRFVDRRHSARNRRHSTGDRRHSARNRRHNARNRWRERDWRLFRHGWGRAVHGRQLRRRRRQLDRRRR
jgi:hypothetical protein